MRVACCAHIALWIIPNPLKYRCKNHEYRLSAQADGTCLPLPVRQAGVRQVFLGGGLNI
jgi:hypothetical protein